MPLTYVKNAGLAFDGGSLSGLRNLLINANPLINQRGYVSGTATTGANQYTLDRWRVVTNGQSLAFSSSGGFVTCTAPAGGVEQVIEGSNNQGGVHTLSWGGTATATVNGNAVSNGGQINLTGGTDVTVRFSNGTFATPQLEQGPIETWPELRPVGLELMLCQRYYEVGKLYGGAYHYTATVNANDYFDITYSFKQTKRITPVMTVTNLGTGSISNTMIDVESVSYRKTGAFNEPLNIRFTASAEF